MPGLFHHKLPLSMSYSCGQPQTAADVSCELAGFACILHVFGRTDLREAESESLIFIPFLWIVMNLIHNARNLEHMIACKRASVYTHSCLSDGRSVKLSCSTQYVSSKQQSIHFTPN